MKFLRLLAIFSILQLLGSPVAVAAKTEVKDDEPVSEKKAEKDAEKYFRKSDEASSPPSSSFGAKDHYLALHLGAFLTSDSYHWGDNSHVGDTGRVTGGITYRMAPMGTLFDWGLRVDFIGNQLPEGRTVMMGIYPVLLFPEATSYFPLYFGLAVGGGVFFQQLKGESSLALAYQLFGGVRFFDLAGENTGLFIEGGMKNHILLLSDGQFNGFFISAGPVFTF